MWPAGRTLAMSDLYVHIKRLSLYHRKLVEHCTHAITFNKSHLFLILVEAKHYSWLRVRILGHLYMALG